MGISSCCLQLPKAEVIEKVELSFPKGNTEKGEVLTIRGNSAEIYRKTFFTVSGHALKQGPGGGL